MAIIESGEAKKIGIEQLSSDAYCGLRDLFFLIKSTFMRNQCEGEKTPNVKEPLQLNRLDVVECNLHLIRKTTDEMRVFFNKEISGKL